jgi:CubicO group peptidase (beta-lactamase class C family)
MPDNSKAQSLVEQFTKEHYNPSISVTVYDNGKYSSYNSGYANIEQKIPATENTIYAIGSSTKAFVAEALCILADRKLIDLDKPVREYLPAFAMHDPYATVSLTIRDMLCHRSGLPRHDTTWLAYQDIEKLVHNIRYFEPFTTFRNKLYYQNHMFLLAGYLVEKVTGTKWDDFVQKEILEPLNMKACFKIEELKSHANPSLPYVVTLAESKVDLDEYWDIYHVGAAGCINSTTSEMAKWIALQLNGGKWDDKQIISEELLKECHTTQMAIQRFSADSPQFDEITNTGYGLGWFVETYRGRKLVHHGGNINGYSAMHFFVPGTGFGASILTNCSGTPIQNSLMYALIDLHFGDEPIDWLDRYKSYSLEMIEKGEAKMDELRNSVVKDTKTSLPLDKYEGKYNHKGYGDLHVKILDGALRVEYGKLEFSSEHLCFDAFLLKWLPREKVLVPAQFVLGLTGEVSSLKVQFEPALEGMIEFKVVKEEKDEKMEEKDD